jgi:acetyl-CoA decarbonylase/synthase complex subunit delta
MADTGSEWSGKIGEVVLGATASEGGTRRVSYRIGGEEDLPFIGCRSGHRPLVAYELCDDPVLWPPVVRDFCGDLVQDLAGWTGKAESDYGADLVRLSLTSTKRRGFSDFAALGKEVHEVLGATGLPIIIEGSNDPQIDSEVFQRCGEAGQGERLLLGTAEAGRYRSLAAAALAYGHGVIAQSPIDINLAKQLNILLREIGVPSGQIVIDPYTGALGYGFEYSYSVMERIRYSALKGDQDLQVPMISAAPDSLNIKEVREAEPGLRDEMAVQWEFYAALPAAVAGAAIVVVRHPGTVKLLKEALVRLWNGEVVSDAAQGA